MKLRFVVLLLVLLSSTLCSVSSAGPIAHYCNLHPKAPLCN
jgi:hypothetical protein